MKQCLINGVSVNYLPYGDAILIMESITKFKMMNGLIIPYHSIKDGVYTWHDKQYTIEFLDN